MTINGGNWFLSQQKPLRSELLLSRWVFSAQGGPGQKLKKCSELSGNELSDYVSKNSGCGL
jgi:hypothetical protein